MLLHSSLLLLTCNRTFIPTLHIVRFCLRLSLLDKENVLYFRIYCCFIHIRHSIVKHISELSPCFRASAFDPSYIQSIMAHNLIDQWSSPVMDQWTCYKDLLCLITADDQSVVLSPSGHFLVCPILSECRRVMFILSSSIPRLLTWLVAWRSSH